jgi:SAM-dependent methyltransferase
VGFARDITSTIGRIGHRSLGGLRRGTERLAEMRYGVRTAEHLYHEHLGLSTDNRVWHDPSNWRATRRALRRLVVGPDDVFVDFGSGLGRALIVASEFPFRRVIGVELSAELNERAQRNVRRARGRQRCGEIDLVTADAAEWSIPPDMTVSYFYCPFLGEVFERVLANILESVDRHPRPVRIVYNYPLEHNAIVRTGRATLLEVAPASWPRAIGPADVIVTYLVLPRDPGLAATYATAFPPRLTGDEPWLDAYDPGFVLEKPAHLGGGVVRSPGASDAAVVGRRPSI